MRKRLLRAEKIKQNERYTRMSQLYFRNPSYWIWQERVWNFSIHAQKGKEWMRRAMRK